MAELVVPEYSAGPALGRRFAYIAEEDTTAGTITIIEELRFIDRAPDDGLIDDPWPGTEGIIDPSFGCDYYGSIAPLGWALCDGSAVADAFFPTVSEMLGGINHQIDVSTVPPDPDDWRYVTVPGAPFQPAGVWIDVKWVAETLLQERVKVYLETTGKTQNELAETHGISRKDMSFWMNQKNLTEEKKRFIETQLKPILKENEIPGNMETPGNIEETPTKQSKVIPFKRKEKY